MLDCGLIQRGQALAIVPDLSIIAEAGVPGFKANQWHGAVTSAKMHPAIVCKISDALRAPDVAERLAGARTYQVRTLELRSIFVASTCEMSLYEP